MFTDRKKDEWYSVANYVESIGTPVAISMSRNIRHEADRRLEEATTINELQRTCWLINQESGKVAAVRMCASTLKINLTAAKLLVDAWLNPGPTAVA